MESWRSAVTNADGERVYVPGHDLVGPMRIRIPVVYDGPQPIELSTGAVEP